MVEVVHGSVTVQYFGVALCCTASDWTVILTSVTCGGGTVTLAKSMRSSETVTFSVGTHHSSAVRRRH